MDPGPVAIRIAGAVDHPRARTALVAELGDAGCCCVPYSHLVSFYGQAGFVEHPVESAPAFLQERIAGYRAEELFVTFMRRAGSADGG
ncbi:MAG TPA: hypothetical protein VEW03_14265 [Longimicrobiaceae bacterium]|nr:hypothetical protein [Longimicrobiaceae bacterium]